MRHLVLSSTLLAALSTASPAHSQASPPAHDPYFIETTDTFPARGPHTITRFQIQDRKGHYWFATWQGIIHYDGVRFTNMTLKKGLIHFHVFSAFEDSRGILWFGTVRGGLYRYNGTTFKLFTTADGLADNSVSAMAEDRAGNIWMATWQGISRYDGARFTSFTTRDGLANDYVNAVMVDRKGVIWAGTKDGISHYNGKSFTPFTDATGRSFGHVAALAEDRTGNIWIGRMDGRGLWRYNPGSLRWGEQQFINVAPDRVSAFYLIMSKTGDLWASGSQINTHGSALQLKYNCALYRWNGKTFETIAERYMPNDFQVFGLMEDRAGKIWFGTMHGPAWWDGKGVGKF